MILHHVYALSSILLPLLLILQYALLFLAPAASGVQCFQFLSEQRRNVRPKGIWFASSVISPPPPPSSASSRRSNPSTETKSLRLLSLSLEDLSIILQGKGRAQSCWDCFRMGVDPIWYFTPPTLNVTNITGMDTDDPNNQDNHLFGTGVGGAAAGDDWTRMQVQAILPPRRHEQQSKIRLGMEPLRRLRLLGSIEERVSSLNRVTVCRDGTTKLLLDLKHSNHGKTRNPFLQIETVIIPSSSTTEKIRKSSSTLCISSQVGCRQACAFCLTGRMGLLHSLSAEEILSQVYWAQKVVRVYGLHPITNIVFMGLGEPADNAVEVVRAVTCLTDPHRFAMAPSRVTISTVAPTPQAFSDLLGQTKQLSSLSSSSSSIITTTTATTPAVLAWSVHASRDELRRHLVPTTKYSMVELRAGLIQALNNQSSKRRRTILLEITLLEGINDSREDALHLVEFCYPIQALPGVKLVVNLIPWNDIQVTTGPAGSYRKPTRERILQFQNILIDNNIRCYVRVTRGDDELAACGQLSTQHNNNNNSRVM